MRRAMARIRDRERDCGAAMNGHQQSACGTVGEAEPSSERRYQEMLGAGLDLLDQGVTVFDAELRMVALNTAFLRLLDFPEGLARPVVAF